jgi:hypothetical protein
MIGVSTQQNTTNLLPALQFKMQEVWLLQTSFAKKNNWSDGIKRTLEQRNIKIELIDLDAEEDSRIDRIASIITDSINTFLPDAEIMWNLGGGQKPQQLALWQTFINRFFEGIYDKSCYANPSTHKIELWKWQDNKLDYKAIDTNSNISLSEILDTFGFDKIDGTLLYKNGKITDSKRSINDYFMFQEFRKFIYEVPKMNPNYVAQNTSLSIDEISKILSNKKEMISSNMYSEFKKRLKNTKAGYDKLEKKEFAQPIFNGLTKNFIEKTLLDILNGKIIHSSIIIQNTELSNALHLSELEISYDSFEKITKHKRPGFYFEEVISNRIIDILAKMPNENQIFEVYQNVKINKRGQKTQVAEYDILFVTKWGTIIALDAKTFDFETKDSDARHFNLQQVAGQYVSFIAVFPYHPDDIDFIPPQLRTLPFRLKSRNVPFFVLADGHTNPIEITNEDGQKINVNLFEHILDTLHLT